MVETERTRQLREVFGVLGSGGVAFVVQIGLFNLLVKSTGALAANAIALAAATLIAFITNRTISFGHRKTSRRSRELLAFLVVNGVAIGLSELVIAAGVGMGVPHDRVALNLLTVVAAVFGLAVRFVGYRRVVFTG